MRRTRFITAIAAALLAIPAQAQNGNRAEALFEAARQKETLEGDLKGAIEQYRKIARGGDRALAAKALIRMAECHQKLGDAEARTLYERVVREFADQKEAAAIARGRLGGAVQARRQSSTQVWSGPEVNIEGSVSPDGNFVSDVDWDTGNLTLREIATGAVRPLTNKGTWQDSGEFAEKSAISRDGKQVAFNWYKDKEERTELRLANISGDPAPRRIYDNPDVTWIEPYDWSPDGKSIAVILSRADRTTQLGLVSVPDGALRVLKSIDWRGIEAVFFSPDGKHLGYDLPESDTSRKRDVFVLSVDGSREIHAVANRGEDLMMGWSPDGKRLLFSSDRGGSTDLWGLPFSDGKPQGAPEILKADIGRVQPMGVTRSGTLFYGFGLGGRRSIIQTAAFDFASGKYLSPPTDVPHEAFESIDGPAWSPDGRFLAYVSERGRASRDRVVVVRSMKADQEDRELRPMLNHFYGPRWSPDGKSFLLQGYDLKGQRGVYQIDAATGQVIRRAVEIPTKLPPGQRWSPDGKSFFFRRAVSGTGEMEFVQRDLATGTEKQLLRRPHVGGNLSPDGRYLATESVDPTTNSRTMLLVPLDGGDPKEVMRVPSEVAPDQLKVMDKGQSLWAFVWAPDSRWFLMRKTFADPKVDDEVWLVPVDGASPRKLATRLSRSYSAFFSHPDGRQVAFNVKIERKWRGELWALENFLPAGDGKK